jgi:hypothetical protein
MRAPMNNFSSLNDKNNTNVNFETFTFGPMICYTKLNQSFIEEIKYRGYRANVTLKDDFSRHLEKKNQCSQDDKNWFMNCTAQIFRTYADKLLNFSLNEIENKLPLTDINLDSLIINYTKQHEFNPVHDQSGDIAFEIYLKVPEEIKKEDEDFEGIGCGPGCVSFYYGENNENMRTQYHFIPGDGDMFLFPAAINRVVPPFKSENVRISITGNLSFDYGKD